MEKAGVVLVTFVTFFILVILGRLLLTFGPMKFAAFKRGSKWGVASEVATHFSNLRVPWKAPELHQVYSMLRVRIDKGKPVVLQGRVGNERFFVLTVTQADATQNDNSQTNIGTFDVPVNDKGEYKIIVSDKKPEDKDVAWVDTFKYIGAGVLLFRFVLVPHGGAIHLPKVTCGDVLLSSAVTIKQDATLRRSGMPIYAEVFLAFLYAIFGAWVIHTLVQPLVHIVFATYVVMIFSGVEVLAVLIAERAAHRWSSLLEDLKVTIPNDIKGVVQCTSAPGYNPANSYLAMQYDCSTEDVVLTGIMPQARYFSLLPYDKWTNSVGAGIYDSQITSSPGKEYRVTLSRHPAGKTNVVDVSSCPEGVLLIRMSFPKSEDDVVKCVTKVSTTPML
eukprot:Rmarinus@m.11859